MADRPTTIGPYRIVRLLGEGGMGTVYEARHEAIERRVAIKVLRPEFARSPEVTARFFNEARAVNLIDHPGLVQISDYGQLPEGAAYIVMEYLKGESLAQRMQRSTVHLPIGEVLQIGWQLADSLAAAHQRGIIHRDLKPDNVMMVPDPHTLIGERAKLLDFGIAKVTELSGEGAVKTETNLVMGTPSYMSPEQCAGAGGVDAKSDVYALGCMLYQMLCGRPPFVAPGSGMVLSMHMFKEPDPRLKLAPSTPPPLADLVHRLLQKDRERRPTMQRLAAELEGLFKLASPPPKKHFAPGADEPSDMTRFVINPSTLGSVAGQTRTSPRRHLGVIAAAAVLLVGVGAFGLRSFLRTAPPQQPARVQSPPQRMVTLRIDSEPPNAEVVHADGQVLGRTPWRHSQPASTGRMFLRLRLAGYSEQEVSLTTEDNDRVQAHLSLREPPRQSPVRVTRPAGGSPAPRPTAPASTASTVRPQPAKPSSSYAKLPLED